ncbi:MAG: CPBP family intramembrane metalloprotease [Clostridiales bacterium]|nr:CPBP family intramembrane metalloprotease [Clostridiales bacterium]
MTKNIIKSRIREFLLITFFITWICWGAIIIANQFGFLKYGTPLSMILFIVGGNAPPIATYILQRKWGETDGLKSYLKRHFNFKSSLKNYSLVLVLLILHFLIPILLSSTNRQMPIYYGLMLIPINIVGGGLEEIGWRGVLQPYLEKITSFTKATVVVAVVWSIWHLPLWFIAETYQSGISFLFFSISVLGMTFSLAVIKKITDNVFLCILFHSSFNSFLSIFMLDQNFSTILTALVEIVLAVVIIFSVVSFKSKSGNTNMEMIK